jgi:hypothetical protein
MLLVRVVTMLLVNWLPVVSSEWPRDFAAE